jgi:hypothetical protein
MFRHLLRPTPMFRRTPQGRDSLPRAARRRHPWLQVELLESRLVPSTVGLVNGNLEVDCNGNNNLIAVDHISYTIYHFPHNFTVDETQVYLNGSTTDWDNLSFSKIVIDTRETSGDTIKLQGSAKEVDMFLGTRDEVTIGDLYRNLDRITDTVYVSGSSGSGSVLVVDDTNNLQAQHWQLGSNYVLRGGPVIINYSGIDYLIVYGSSGPSIYDVLATSAAPTYLYPQSSHDTVNVSGTTGSLDVSPEPLLTFPPTGGSVVNVGDDFNINKIQSVVDVTPGGTGPTTVNINDRYDRNPANPVIDTTLGGEYTEITGLAAPIICASAGCSNINVNTGPATTYIAVVSTTPLGPNGQGVLTVTGDSDPCYVGVGSGSNVQTIQGTLRIRNEPFVNRIYVDDSTDAVPRSVTLQSVIIGNALFGEIDGLAPAAIQYQYNETDYLALYTGPGDSIDVQATGTTTDLIALGVSTSIFVGGSQQGLQSIQGPLNIAGSNTIPDNISVVIGDVPDTQSQTVTLDTITPDTEYVEVSASTGQPITIASDSLAALTIEGGGGDTIEVNNTSAYSFPTTISTNHGNSTVNVHATSASPLTVNLSGNDTVNIGDAANGLANISTPVTVVGSGDQFTHRGDAIDVLDQANPNPETYVVSNATLNTSTREIVNYQAEGFDTLVLYPSLDPATMVVDGHDPNVFTLVTSYDPPPPGGGAAIRPGPGLVGQTLLVNNVPISLHPKTAGKGGAASEAITPAPDAMLLDLLNRAARISRVQATAAIDLFWTNAAVIGMPTVIAP